MGPVCAGLEPTGAQLSTTARVSLVYLVDAGKEAHGDTDDLLIIGVRA